jgi:hypothetical protein
MESLELALLNRTHEVRGSIPLSSTETASIAEIACQ